MNKPTRTGTLREERIAPKQIMYYETETTLLKISEVGNAIAPQIYAEVEKLGLEVGGPMEFIYFGMDDKPDTVFRLQIAVPINQVPAEYTGTFSFGETSDLSVVSSLHEGGMASIPQAYERIFSFIGEKNMIPKDECREVYVNWVEQESPDNRTEVQVGIQA